MTETTGASAPETSPSVPATVGVLGALDPLEESGLQLVGGLVGELLLRVGPADQRTCAGAGREARTGQPRMSDSMGMTPVPQNGS